MAPKTILLCTDFSGNSGPARDLAVDYARTFCAKLVILHVIDTWAGFPAYEGRIPIDVGQVVRSMESAVTDDLTAMAKQFRSVVGEVETHSRFGAPAQEIVRLAADESVDLIVMGTHGWTGLKHVLLGSVAENVVRTARCPVLIVRPDTPAPD